MVFFILGIWMFLTTMRMLGIYPPPPAAVPQAVEEEGRCAALLQSLTIHVECSVK